MIAYYDHQPPQIEAIGNGDYFYRWDIEEVGLPERMMPTEDTDTETEGFPKPSMWKCREVVFTPPISVDVITDLVAADMGVEKDSLEYKEVYHSVGLAVIPLDMDAAKKELEEKIWDYDKQTEEFFINGISVWLNREERQTILRRCDAEESKGMYSVVLRKNGLKFDLPISTCRAIVLDVEFYASRCWDNREDLLVAKDELTTAEEILAFDVTSGYPEKLAF